MRWNRRGFTLLRPGLLLWLALLMLGAFGLQAQETDDTSSAGPHVAELTIDGPIGPATKDYILRSIDTAHEAGAHAVLIRMDTPGGLDAHAAFGGARAGGRWQ